MSQYSLSTTSPFLKGLNTELNKLVDTAEYTNDELNCMVRANNTRSRRPGLDYEELYKFSHEYLDLSMPDLAFQCIEWTDINSPDEAETYTGYPYIVCQVGGTLIFFRNQGQPYSGHQQNYTVDLKDYALDPSSDLYMRKRCRFTAAYGCIFVTSEAIKPFYLRSAQEPDDPSVPVVSYPMGSLPLTLWNSKLGRWAGVGTFTFYINGVQIAQCATSDYNAGAVGNCSTGPWMLTSTQLADYWNNLPSGTRRGIVATPMHPDMYATRWGHNYQEGGSGAYINDYMTFEGTDNDVAGLKIGIKMTGLAQWRSSEHYETIEYSCTLAGGSSYQYKDNLALTIRDTNVGANDYLGIADNPAKMSYAHLYNLLNQGWTPKLIADYYNAQSPKVFPGNNLAQQFLKDDKTSAFKPQNAINMTFGNSPAARGHEILSYFDQRRVTTSKLVDSFTELVSDIGGGVTFEDIVDDSWELDDKTTANAKDAYSQVPDVKPRKEYVADLCAYAGRIFYLTGDVLLYSQVIAEDISKADKCYTEADPTGEEISDVIESDGGLISLPDIGKGLKLQVLGDSLLVFGSRDNMILSGTANNIFTATAYSAGAVEAVPTQSPDSFVATEYGIFYWGVTGIIALGIGQNGIETKDLTTDRMLTWFGKISNGQHKACKGVYSASKKKIYWFYPSDEALPRRLDLCLVYDIQRDAFCPQQIVKSFTEEDTDIATPEVVSGVQLKVPFKGYKEYPIYAYVEPKEETITYSFSGAMYGRPEGWDIYFRATSVDENMCISNGLAYILEQVPNAYNNLVFDPREQFDLVVKACLGTNGSVTYMGSEIFHCEYSGGFSPFWCSASAGSDQWTICSNSSGTHSANEPVLDGNTFYWFRWVYDGTHYLTYYIEDNGYSVNSLPVLSNWTAIATAADGFAPRTTADEGWLRVQVAANVSGTGNLLDLTTFKDLHNGTIACQWHSADGSTVYFTKPATADTVTYLSADMTIPVGTVGDMINDGNEWFVWDMYNVTVYSEGADTQTIKFSTTAGDAYMPSRYFGNYLTGAHIPATSIEVFKDMKCTELFNTDCYINYPAAAEITSVDDANKTNYAGYIITYTGDYTGDVEVYDGEGYRIMADTPLDSEEFNYESSILLCLDPANCKVTFGDFRNNRMRDWAEGDRHGAGYEFDSYMISHPVNAQDFIRSKSMPYLISYFKRTETGETVDGQYIYPSHCQGSVRWDWRTDGKNSKWDSPNELYRPRKRTLLSEGYITSKTNIRGIGRAFQVKLQGVRDDNFIVEALGFDLCKDERI